MQLTTRRDRVTLGRELPPALAAALVLSGLLLVFALDRVTGAAPVQHLYYAPIILAGFRFRQRGGIIAAVAAILLYHVANPHLLTSRYEERDLVQIALFIAVGAITAALSNDAARLRHLALTDDLTGLHNLRSFEAHLDALMQQARDTGTPVVMLVLDVDRLKSLNDAYGHLTGAEAVRHVGHIIARHLPDGAVACRYGGDEFAIAVPHCTLDQGRGVAEVLCRTVRESAPILAGRAFAAGALSVSIGGACATFGAALPPRAAPGASDGEALFGAADRALYRAKGAGRNQVWLEQEAAQQPASAPE
jgi:diguanylate cyclase (GGDEF)-like protein